MLRIAIKMHDLAKRIQLYIDLPVGRYIWVGNHDGFQMKPSIPKISTDRNTTLSERKTV